MFLFRRGDSSSQSSSRQPRTNVVPPLSSLPTVSNAEPVDGHDDPEHSARLSSSLGPDVDLGAQPCLSWRSTSGGGSSSASSSAVGYSMRLESEDRRSQSPGPAAPAETSLLEEDELAGAALAAGGVLSPLTAGVNSERAFGGPFGQLGGAKSPSQQANVSHEEEWRGRSESERHLASALGGRAGLRGTSRQRSSSPTAPLMRSVGGSCGSCGNGVAVAVASRSIGAPAVNFTRQPPVPSAAAAPASTPAEASLAAQLEQLRAENQRLRSELARCKSQKVTAMNELEGEADVGAVTAADADSVAIDVAQIVGAHVRPLTPSSAVNGGAAVHRMGISTSSVSSPTHAEGISPVSVTTSGSPVGREPLKHVASARGLRTSFSKVLEESVAADPTSCDAASANDVAMASTAVPRTSSPYLPGSCFTAQLSISSTRTRTPSPRRLRTTTLPPPSACGTSGGAASSGLLSARRPSPVQTPRRAYIVPLAPATTAQSASAATLPTCRSTVSLSSTSAAAGATGAASVPFSTGAVDGRLNHLPYPARQFDASSRNGSLLRRAASQTPSSSLATATATAAAASVPAVSAMGPPPQALAPAQTLAQVGPTAQQRANSAPSLQRVVVPVLRALGPTSTCAGAAGYPPTTPRVALPPASVVVLGRSASPVGHQRSQTPGAWRADISQAPMAQTLMPFSARGSGPSRPTPCAPAQASAAAHERPPATQWRPSRTLAASCIASPRTISGPAALAPMPSLVLASASATASAPPTAPLSARQPRI
eukprot:TRINITY_DN17338_c0_g2_i1.p1 TRINITY_DN17338_c0_g2~~TRINITY_DN17338_c0_g2_i1.p1  ORF type:complete len:770 (+),score=137.61 TRINITY_DN17338_c0_g2_i1:26-2335(+)